MLFYSVAYVRLDSKKVLDKQCPVCDKNSLHLKTLGKYITILSIPLIKLKSRAIYFCSNCKYEVKIREKAESV